MTIQEFKDLYNKMSEDKKDICPSCGYCPHCGRQNTAPRYIPMPYYQPYPYWQVYPYQNWYGNTYGNISISSQNTFLTSNGEQITYTNS